MQIVKDRTPFFGACCLIATALCLSLNACNSSEARAQEAFSAYQAASAAGDVRAARRALLQLVKVKDNVPDYWQQLGLIQIQLGALNDAYYAFNRARELDRGNAQVLRALTQIALSSGDMDLAEKHARELELLAPDDPAATLAYGYIALTRQNYDEADQEADKLLAAFPNESNSRMLKARILFARGEKDKATAFLDDQLKAKPDDLGALKTLVLLHQRAENWPAAAEAASRLYRLNPKDVEAGTTAVDSYFRAGNIAAARAASQPFFGPDAPGDALGTVLDLWARHWKTPEALAEAREYARRAGPRRALAWATYFNEAGSPKDALALVGERPQWPVTRANMSNNAIRADSLAMSGNRAEAKRLFDAILTEEPDHVYALRGRINLQLSMGQGKPAIVDAQRLVSNQPRSAPYRLLLARAYQVAGEPRQVDRTLWDAFHEIPGNMQLYEALRAHVHKTRGPEAGKEIENEFAQQRDAELARELI